MLSAGREVQRSTEAFVPLSEETGQSGGFVLIRESENGRQSDHSARKMQHDHHTGPWGVTEDLATGLRLQVTNARWKATHPK